MKQKKTKMTFDHVSKSILFLPILFNSIIFFQVQVVFLFSGKPTFLSCVTFEVRMRYNLFISILWITHARRKYCKIIFIAVVSPC